MKKLVALAAALTAVAVFIAACTEDPAGTRTTQTMLGGGKNGGPQASGSACLGSLSLAVVANSGKSAIESGIQCEDDLYFLSGCAQAQICRIFLKWDSGSTTYSWDDQKQSGVSGCYHQPYLRAGESFLMQESVNRLITALDDPAIYDRCFAAENPVTGEKVYTYYFDDPNDPCGVTIRRTLTLIVTPNTTCN